MSEHITLKSIRELIGLDFLIPSYQRGYRWTEQQVKDLLNDLWEFCQNVENGIYCIQPLVVKGIPDMSAVEKIGLMYSDNKKPTIEAIKEHLSTKKWEVIDGQQRLTTIKIMLSYLGCSSYQLEYDTRNKKTESEDPIKKTIGSTEFLDGITNDTYQCASDLFPINKVADSNIDYYHMKKSYDTIKYWFETEHKCNKKIFISVLYDKVKFIWYETHELDPIKVFTRLNIGKIALTNAELIKALFLNQSNFKSNNKDAIRLQQIEIAGEWDKIEYTLQNDEFWLFIHNIGYSKPTRIDYIFDLMREKDVYGIRRNLGDKFDEKIGTDEYRTFRYFYEYFQNAKKEEKINEDWLRYTWLNVKTYFQIFEEWYNNLDFYHYVGYLVERKYNVIDIIDLYNDSKNNFKTKIKFEIRKTLSACSSLGQEYEKGKPKTACYPLLLLYNILTVINQNSELEKSKYGQAMFYKFPFHLLKKENWDMEHIDSNSTNELKKISEQKEWLKDCQNEIAEEQLKKKINLFLNQDKPDGFEILVEEVNKEINKNLQRLDENKKNQDGSTLNEKNLIWNYCLLDAGTNRSYGNAIFPVKRRKIIQKDSGMNGVSFVPPCTKNVFLKYYTPQTNILRAWDLNDAKAYILDIERVLFEYLYPDLHNIPKQKMPAIKGKEIYKIPRHVLSRYKDFIEYITHKEENNE